VADADYERAVDLINDLPIALRTTRERLGLTYRQAADRAGVSASHIWAIEENSKNPSAAVLVLLFQWLADPGEGVGPGRVAELEAEVERLKLLLNDGSLPAPDSCREA
jgi:transcriptional regulator with XRE-family HTH domain